MSRGVIAHRGRLQVIRAAASIWLLFGMLASAQEHADNAPTSKADIPSLQLRQDVERLRFHLQQVARALLGTPPVRGGVHSEFGSAATATMTPIDGGMTGGVAAPLAAAPVAAAPLAAAPVAVAAPAPLPGFNGAAHLYHAGVNDFFLDAAGPLALSTEQRARLRIIQARSVLDQTEAQRKIEAAEQQMWKLTGAARPEMIRIEATVREIEKLRADRRLAFIRAVGEAAGVLTDAQRAFRVGAPRPAVSPALADGGAMTTDLHTNAGDGGMGPM